MDFTTIGLVIIGFVAVCALIFIVGFKCGEINMIAKLNFISTRDDLGKNLVIEMLSTTRPSRRSKKYL